MKIIAKFLPLLLLAFVACEKATDQKTVSDLKWETNWDEAVAAAKKEKQNLLVEFGTSWCPYCKYIEERVFPKPAVRERLEKLTLLYLDGDKVATQPLMQKHDIAGFPTFILFDPAGKELTRFNDINAASELVALLDHFKPEVTPADEVLLRPARYKEEAEALSSETLKKNLLQEAAAIIETRIADPNSLDEKTLRVTLDQHVDLLANIYQELGSWNKIAPAYLKAASLTETQIEQTGGIEKNSHLISTVAYFYRRGGKPENAIPFLKNAQQAFPEYWPLHSSFAKTYLETGELEKAKRYAQKALELADEIAKSKLSLLLAEIEMRMEDPAGAVTVLEEAKQYLLSQGTTARTGRSAKMLETIEKQIGEYESWNKKHSQN
ncbi:MAG: thioredoxin family protein [Deltaproteobacteria bacterium]|nr:thioredoxin family protein [Deltaproteobacteria bacterium]